ncbi:MAG: ATP-binding cassette domain-containing protein, partial [Proteobacteria bacterium]
MTDILLDINGLTKAYPGVVANKNVSFQIRRGEVHALLGENGAGKSTLVKMIYGLVKPDSGSMTFQDQQFAPTSPNAARSTGVAMVFQHFSLFDALSVAENIALGMDDAPKPRDLAKNIRQVSNAYGLPLEPNRIVGTLSAGERQRVEIIRCLLQNPKLLIMDEPTSVLTPQEVEVLFKTLRQLKSEGTAILYISHKLEEIRALCDTATILRHGEKVDTCIPATTTAREMAEMMVGASFANPIKANRETGDTVLSLNNVSASSAEAFGTSLQGISLDLKKGEILGIGGVAGNGQDELLATLSGETTVASDMIIFDGQAIGKQGPTARRKIGLLSAPEERLGHAAAPAMSLRENTV